MSNSAQRLTDQSSSLEKPNVVQRLNARIADAKRLGFQVRSELLDGQEASWCVVRGKRMLFVDLSQSASEQLRQLNEILESFVADSHTLPVTSSTLDSDTTSVRRVA